MATIRPAASRVREVSTGYRKTLHGYTPRAPISEQPAKPPNREKSMYRRSSMKYFSGLDWGGTNHAICVVNHAGQTPLQTEVRHDTHSLESLQKQLKRIVPASAIPIAIERPSGLIVDAQVAFGHTVVPIHPNAVKACPPRYSAAGRKNALAVATFPRRSGINVYRLGSYVRQSSAQIVRHELRPVIQAKLLSHAVEHHHVGQRFDHLRARPSSQ